MTEDIRQVNTVPVGQVDEDKDCYLTCQIGMTNWLCRANLFIYID